MKRLFLLILFFLAVSACSKVKVVSPGASGEELADMKKGAEIVQVNNAVIREGYLDMLSVINPRVKSQIANPMMKKKVVESLVDQELLYQESVRRGLDRKKEVQDKAGLYRRIIIAQAVMEEEMNRKAREYYEKNKGADFTKVSVSHIQIDFKKPDDKAEDKDKKAKDKGKEPATAQEKSAALERAKSVKARLSAGEDFAKVAEETTDDAASKKKGGDLGKISRDDKRLARRGMDKLIEAAFSLKNGQTSDIIETPKAWHIIKVTSEPETTPFEEAEKTIEFQIQKEVKEQLLASLKQSAKIVYAEEPEAPAAPAPKESTPENKPEAPPSAGVAPSAPVAAGTPAESESPAAPEIEAVAGTTPDALAPAETPPAETKPEAAVTPETPMPEASPAPPQPPRQWRSPPKTRGQLRNPPS